MFNARQRAASRERSRVPRPIKSRDETLVPLVWSALQLSEFEYPTLDLIDAKKGRAMITADQFHTVRKPLNEAETLASACYTSQEFYDLEVQNIFRKKWLLIGRTDEWKEPGAFKCYNRFGVPFFITKDQDGKIHAFANSCRHRGSEILSGSRPTGQAESPTSPSRLVSSTRDEPFCVH